MTLTGHVAIITGASSGIGAATARVLSEAAGDADRRRTSVVSCFCLVLAHCRTKKNTID